MTSENDNTVVLLIDAGGNCDGVEVIVGVVGGGVDVVACNAKTGVRLPDQSAVAVTAFRKASEAFNDAARQLAKIASDFVEVIHEMKADDNEEDDGHDWPDNIAALGSVGFAAEPFCRLDRWQYFSGFL